MERVWIGFGGLVGLVAVALAAVGAHALPDRLDAAALRMVASGVQMQGWHALALLGVGVWAPRGGRLAHLAGAAFLVGIVLFCAGVYAIALAGVRLPLVAPTGGVLLMLGWLLLALSAVWPRGV
jgi:uncharacterized membrane protein YgdD (TMEM256/DUF423 family)